MQVKVKKWNAAAGQYADAEDILVAADLKLSNSYFLDPETKAKVTWIDHAGGLSFYPNLDGIHVSPDLDFVTIYSGQAAAKRGLARAKSLGPRKRSRMAGAAAKAGHAKRKAKALQESAVGTIPQKSESADTLTKESLLEMIHANQGTPTRSTPAAGPPRTAPTTPAVDLLITPKATAPPPVKKELFPGLDRIFSYSPPPFKN